MREGFPWLVHPRAGSCGRQTQTTNLGVRSSNLFGRAINSLILIQNFCAIFCLLTAGSFRAAPGSTRQVFTAAAAQEPKSLGEKNLR